MAFVIAYASLNFFALPCIITVASRNDVDITVDIIDTDGGLFPIGSHYNEATSSFIQTQLQVIQSGGKLNEDRTSFDQPANSSVESTLSVGGAGLWPHDGKLEDHSNQSRQANSSSFQTQLQVIQIDGERKEDRTSSGLAATSTVESALSIGGAELWPHYGKLEEHSNQSRHSSTMVNGLDKCVDAYANGLDNVQLGLGRHLSAYPLVPTGTSQRSVVFAANPGTTATSSLVMALYQMGLTAAHHADLHPHGYMEWVRYFEGCQRMKTIDDSLECYRSFDYTDRKSVV